MPTRDLPTGIVTFLFSDIEGSTRLLQALGRDAYGELLSTHHGLFRDASGDAVVSTEGDSFFCAFRTPGEAVDAAVAVQRALDDQEWPDGVEVRVRMGMHTGEGVLGGDNYVGLDVHRAARISAAAHGGQVLLSAAAYQQARATLPGEVGIRDLGEHRLKDLAEPEHLYQLTIPGLSGDFPPPNSLEAPTSLPEHLSTFVGRAAERRAVIDTLGSARLVTLTGPGGTGKTRLGVEAAGGAVPDMPGGVFFAGLATLDDPDLVPARVAAELSVGEQIGRPIEETLADYLRPRRALLVLDNCEHLADAAAELAEDLLRECPGLKILATSREALMIPGEHVYPVEPMALTASGNRGPSDAVTLFATRAAEVSPDFELGRWAGDVERICARLDGIPLAIELAAARVGMLTPTEILDRLEDGLGLLKSRARSVPLRHRTLEAAVQWSYDLLDPEAQRLLRTLAIFRGGFTLGAVHEVCYQHGAESEVLDHLTELHDKSLLTKVTTFLGTRFALLETIRTYADARLRDAGEHEVIARRHREYFISRARHESRRLTQRDQLDALARLEADHDNLRVVIRRDIAAGNFDAAADMAGWLVWFWYLHAHFTEGERLATRIIAELPENPARPWLRLLLGAAQYDFRIGNYARCNERLDTCLRLAKEQGADRIAMWAHAYLATNALYTIDLDVVRANAAEAARQAEAIGDVGGYAYSVFLQLSEQAWTANEANMLDEQGVEVMERLAPLAAGARASGDRNLIGHVLQLEGQVFAAIGDRVSAAGSLDESIAALTELGTVGCACHCLDSIAGFAATAGDLESAMTLVGAAEHFREEIGIASAGLEDWIRATALDLCLAGLSTADVDRLRRKGSGLSLAEATQLARQTLVRSVAA